MGLFMSPRGPKRTCFGTKCPFWESWRSSEGPHSLGLLCLGWTHGYHKLWPGIKPLPGGNLDFWPHIGPTLPKIGTFRAKTGTFGAPGCQEEAPYHKSNLGTAAGGSWDQIWLPGALRVPPRPPKGAFWAKTSPFGAPGGQKRLNTRPKCVGYNDSKPGRPISGSWDQIGPPGTLQVHPGPPKEACRG